MEPLEQRHSHLSSSTRSSSLFYDLHIEAALDEFEAVENEIFGEELPLQISESERNIQPEYNHDDKNYHVLGIESKSLLENM